MRKVLNWLFWMGIGVQGIMAQCPTTTITGNLVPNNGDTLSGTYNVTGNFILGPGVTVYVRPFRSNGCGALQIFAAGNVQLDGTIHADGAGYPGGLGGQPGSASNVSFIESCPVPNDQCGGVITFGGSSGNNSNPGGGGNAGAAGLDGGGRKNQCLSFGDVGGRIGGSGGAGGGAGGTYAGLGTAGGNGGLGSLPTMSTPDPTCTNHPISFGFGGNGGVLGGVYGTLSGNDIDLGSGGAGGGGGGRGRFAGTAGAQGGAGGGLVRIESGGDFSMTGSITANGLDGGLGGNGGGAGVSPRCCSDLCAGVDEYTHNGAGGGGGGAGGGSGGGVFLRVGGIATLAGTIDALGGTGGNGGQTGPAGPNLSLGGGLFCATTTSTAPAGTNGGFGGGGGGGRAKIFYNACAPGNSVSTVTNFQGGGGNGGNAANGVVFISNAGSLIVGSAQPASQLLCYLGDPGNLNSLPSTGGYGGISYQWQSQQDCSGPWANVPGATSLNYDPPAGILDTTCFRLQITSGSCTAFSDTLTVSVIPPQGASITPAGSVPACVGDTIDLLTSGGTGASYQWLFNGIPIPGAIDSVYEAVTAGAYTVQINYPVGCAGLSNPTNVTFDNPPAAFISASGDTILCPGDQLVLQGFGSGTYQWQLGGIDIPGATAATLPLTGPGTYSLNVTTAGGCLGSSADLTITAGAAATASISAATPLAFCAGDSVLLNAAGGSIHAWYRDGIFLPGATGSSLPTDSSGTYAVVVASPDGCLDTTSVIVFSDTVVAGINPAVNVAACVGDSALFLASGGGSYTWLFNQQPLPDTLNFLFAGIVGDYTLIVTSPIGCTDTTPTYAFTYFPPLVPTAQAQGAPYICPGDQLPMRGQVFGALSYQWLLNDTLIPGATGLNYVATEPGVYAFQVSDQYGCYYTSPYFSVYPGADPVAEIVPQVALPICDGDSLVLLGRGGDSLVWYRDGILVQAGSDTLLVVGTPSDGTYTLATFTGCGADTSTVLTVGSGVGPTAGFTYQNQPGNLVEFVDESISGATWLWNFGGAGNSSTLQNPQLTFPNPGTYPVTMITWDIFGCSDTISLLVNVVDPVFFIPNVFSPNGDGINDVATTNFNSLRELNFLIYDRWGKAMFSTTSATTFWDGTCRGREVPDGVYYYHLKAIDNQGNDLETKGNISVLR